MQPGGHFDPHETPHEAVLREALEETGLEGLALDPWHSANPWPLDVDSHRIPASTAKNEAAHWHHDLRYLLLAPAGATIPHADESEVGAWRWQPVRDLLRGRRRSGRRPLPRRRSPPRPLGLVN